MLQIVIINSGYRTIFSYDSESVDSHQKFYLFKTYFCIRDAPDKLNAFFHNINDHNIYRPSRSDFPWFSPKIA